MEVVAVHECLDPRAEFVHAGEGVPVVVLVFEDGPERFRGCVVVTRPRDPSNAVVPSGRIA